MCKSHNVSSWSHLLTFTATMSARQQTAMEFMLLLSISCSLCCSAGSITPFSHRTLKEGDRLNIQQNMYSAKSNFVLSFLPSGVSGDKYYLVISRYDLLVVWVANRDAPILDDTCFLTVDNNGAFVIERTAGNPIVLFPGDHGAGNSTRVATLNDDGNLVFSELHQDGSTWMILWQSFHYPTDTLLPGMMLGVIYDEGAPRLSLNSWLTSKDPSPGAFTLEWDPKELEMVLRRRGVIVWKSGVLKDGIFPSIPNWVFNNYSLMVGADVNSLRFFSNKITYLQLTDVGRLVFQSSSIKEDKFSASYLDIMDICYGYNNDNGCVEWWQPKCRSDMPTFTQQSGFFLWIDTGKADEGVQYVNASLGQGDCRAICWEDCDCVAYAETYETGCRFWKGKSQLRLAQSFYGPSAYVISTSPLFSESPTHPPKPSAEDSERHFDSELEETKGRGGRTRWIWIAMASSVTLAVSCLIPATYWRRMRRIENRDVAEIKEEKYLSECTTLAMYRYVDENTLTLFNLHCLSEATNQFSEENKLGQGGFGPVFKGTLPEGRQIAVKRLSMSSGQGLEEFRNELELIAKLQHVNLVCLLGYCIQGDEKMLVYEYMPNRSLDSFLFDPSRRSLLECTTRLKIIEGIAQGLRYLHEFSRLMIIHRDLKASNILLDESLNPKISDFGMARIFKRNELKANTKRIVGTYGYMSPEYAMEGIFSVKSDVFSFGILILEVVTGRRNTSFNHFDKHINLIGYAWELWQKEAWAELLDPTMKYSCSMNDQFHRTIHVGLLCVEASASNRPTMSEIISMLTDENMSLPLVKRPAFLISSTTMDREHSSINGLSLSSPLAAR